MEDKINESVNQEIEKPNEDKIDWSSSFFIGLIMAFNG